MTQPAFKAMSLSDYLAFEEGVPEKHEFVGGFVYPLHAQAGVSQGHSRITMNIAGNLFREAARQNCRLHQGEMRLHVGNAMFYPDVMLACGDTFQNLYETQPCFLAEVLSPSTAQNDRIGKYALYTSIPTLQTYLIAEQDERRIYLYERQGAEWVLRELVGEGELYVPCLSLSLSLDDIYGGMLQD